MLRERLAAGFRALLPRGARAGRRAAEAVRSLRSEAARERGRRAWATVRRRPDVVLAAVLVAGVVVMVLHWT
jgi:hypothetical protein